MEVVLAEMKRELLLVTRVQPFVLFARLSNLSLLTANAGI